jgi:hypothetical protein
MPEYYVDITMIVHLTYNITANSPEEASDIAQARADTQSEYFPHYLENISQDSILVRDEETGDEFEF